MLVFDGVWKSFAGVTALRGISIAVSQGDALLVTGPSGAGKSTLLRLLYCAEWADRGEVYVAGRCLARLDRASVPYVRRNLGVLFQDFRLLPDRSALDNVAIALEILNLPRRHVIERSLAMLDEVGLARRADTRASALSGGEQQRVALARALVGEPTVVLADEPTGSLDPVRAEEMLTLLDRVHRRGATLVVATHDPAVVAYGATRCWRRAHLDAGQLADLDLPAARPARLDEDTDGFSTRERPDSTLMGHRHRLSA
jgi:cell division transport system ATP-binding protein